MIPRALIPALVLPLAVTAASLSLVAWNRSSSRGPIQLSNEDVYLQTASSERTAVSAWLTWQSDVPGRDGITRDELETLGFDLPADPPGADSARDYWRSLPRQAWVAFELVDDAALARPGGSPRPRSHLVPIDAARTAGELLARYPDGSRYLVTAGIVRPTIVSPPGGQARFVGSVEALQPRTLHIPRQLMPALVRPPFRIAVRYGRRHEPWVDDVSR
jgi:hypothetical protein